VSTLSATRPVSIDVGDLCPGPGLNRPEGSAPNEWQADLGCVRFTVEGPFPPGWYEVRLAVRSGGRFTVRKRADLVFDPADPNPRPPGRETLSWNRNVDEQFMLRLTRPASRLRWDFQQAEGRFTIEAFSVRSVSKAEAFRRAIREKLRLIRAYQCVRPVLWRGGKMLLAGRFRQFGAKVLKGLIDSRQMRLGHSRGDEVDAAWWRRHALTKDEADRIAAACEAMIDPPPIAVLIPTDGSRLDQVRLAAHSVRRQIYPHWQLLLAASGPAGLQPHLNGMIGPDPRMKLVRVSGLLGLSVAIGKALGETECSHVVVLPPGVELAEHALYHLAATLQDAPKAGLIGGRIYDAWKVEDVRRPKSSSGIPSTTGTGPARAAAAAMISGGQSAIQARPDHRPSPPRRSAREGELNAAEVLKVPEVFWLTSVRELVSMLPRRLSMRTIAEWTESFPRKPSFTPTLLEPILAYPIEDCPLIDRARVGRKPVEKITPLFLSTDLKGITGYDHLAFALLKGLPSVGAELRFHQISQVRHELLPPGMLIPHGGWHPDCKQLILSPPFLAHRFQPNKNSAIFTMWESDRLEPTWVQLLNQAAVVIVPSRWAVECFRACGVTVPMEVVPLGYDPLMFHPLPTSRTARDVCVFGTAGALGAGGLRKNAQLLIDLFRKTFPSETDVRLRVKITPSSPSVETEDDPRIEVIRAVLPHGDLVDWYRSLTAYVNASAGEGFGLHLIEAMACGRPLISPCYSGLTEFFDESVGYPVEYSLVPVNNHIYTGNWAEPCPDSLAAQMRRVYADRQEADRYGEKAAARAKNFTWKAAGQALVKALRNHGFIAPE
jgi:glycosyltransferase involved in cell wall biosynthesis